MSIAKLKKFTPQSPFANAWRPAVNIGERKDVAAPDILLLHYTGMGSAEGALKWLCGKQSAVSCHYFIFEDGRIVQLVDEEKRAQHAGVGSWQGHIDVNSRSIGIEIANAGHSELPGQELPDFPPAQMEAVLDLCNDIITRHAIKPQLVLAHSDIAPGRKIDPGENFDWRWLAKRGVGHWVEPSPIKSGKFFQRGDVGQPVEALQSLLALYGYGVDVNGLFEEKTHQIVMAFQRHFRQEKVDGVADVSTIETLHRLLKSVAAKDVASS